MCNKPDINPCIYDQLIFDKEANNTPWKNTVSKNGTKKIRCSHVKE